jgi:hypothetical protein
METTVDNTGLSINFFNMYLFFELPAGSK